MGLKTGDGVVWLLQVKNRTQISAKTALISCTTASAAAFSPDSSMLAVGDGSVIRVFETATAKQLTELHDASWALELKFDRANILISSHNSGLSVWDVARSKRLTLIPQTRCDSAGNCTYEIYDHYSLSPDQTRLALAGRNISGIVVRDLEGKITAQIPALNETFSFAFRPARPSNLIVADGKGHIASWNAATGELLREFSASLHPFIRLAFVPGSQTDLVTFDAASALVWNIDNGQILQHWRPLDEGRFVSPDGKWVTNPGPGFLEVPRLAERHLIAGIRYKSYGDIVVQSPHP